MDRHLRTVLSGACAAARRGPEAALARGVSKSRSPHEYVPFSSVWRDRFGSEETRPCLHRSCNQCRLCPPHRRRVRRHTRTSTDTRPHDMVHRSPLVTLPPTTYAHVYSRALCIGSHRLDAWVRHRALAPHASHRTRLHWCRHLLTLVGVVVFIIIIIILLNKKYINASRLVTAALPGD